jgi:hypothetical protein
MSVRLPSGLPRPGLPLQGPAAKEKGEKAQQPAESKSSGKATGKGAPAKGGGGAAVKGGSAKGPSLGGAEQGGGQEGLAGARSGETERGGGGSAAKQAQQQDGMAPSTSRGANPAALGALDQPQRPGAPAPSAPMQAPAMAPQVDVGPMQGRQAGRTSESQGQRTATEGPSQNSAKEAAEGRARLRVAILNRIHRGLTDVEQKLSNFLNNPGRQGVVTLPIILSESTVTHEWWKGATAVPEDRAYLALVLGEPASVDDGTLLRALRDEVHQAFVEFQRTPPGMEARRLYEAALQKYEAARIQPIIWGHDGGPLLEECARLGLPCERDFTRSLLVSEWMLAISQSPDEGSKTQVMVAGLNLSQLGALVGHLRRLNPMLSNAQLRALLLRASTDMRLSLRKALGEREVEQVQELARQLLRLRAVEHLVV